ncbi:MAG: anti-sigma factor [Gammaproteobacteria bacterium]|nr:anti-sigma factor [Gammaproteobacteria bacterium]
MSCEHTQQLLDAYVDGELDVEKSLAIEQHLSACPACRKRHEARRWVRVAVQSQARYFTVPDPAVRRIQAHLDKAGGGGRTLPARWLSLAATAAIAALLGSGTTFWIGRTSSEDLLTQEAVANHSRSLMVAGRITDISSSDQHTVKPWFNGRVDFSPLVVDLTAQGFALVGGRLDYLDNHPVAALVYRHRQHLINLFVWPDDKSAAAPMRAFARHGYHVLHWSGGGMRYWAVSDLNPADLKAFGELLATQG